MIDVELSKSVTCAIGEYLVLAELLKRGYEAYIAHGPTQQGWDLMVIQGSEIKRVQVKTIGWPKINQRTVTINPNVAFDFLVTVLLDLENPHSRFLICTKDELIEKLSPENEERKGNARSLSVPKELDSKDWLGQWENNWDKLKEKQKND